jgi:hypothetical protein
MSAKYESSQVENEKQLAEHNEDAPQLESGLTRRGGANTQLDDAARLLAEAGGVDYTAEDSKRVLRKIDLYVCLPMCLIYFIQQVSMLLIKSCCAALMGRCRWTNHPFRTLRSSTSRRKRISMEHNTRGCRQLSTVLNWSANLVCSSITKDRSDTNISLVSGYALIIFPVKYWVMFNMTCCE